MSRVNWTGLVAAILTTGIAVAIALAFVIPVIRDMEISPQALTMLSTMLGTAIGAVGMYLAGDGDQNRRNGKGGQSDAPESQNPPAERHPRAGGPE